MASIDRARLGALLDQQERTIRSKYGCTGVSFKVVVEDGKAKLKAVPQKGG